ncbi:MAG: NAD(P)-dependent oxidoreductase [Geminicoccaceae bacterium]|nr:NAD(P)-dependent oxidoreductase [Geminicoccaceae bacterium]
MRAERLGIVGLGSMGAPIARRLALAGFPTTVLDRDEGRMRALEGTPHLSLAADLEELEREADILLTCLPSEKAVLEVAAALRRPGLLVADLSTIRPTTARRLHAELTARGIRHVECPMIEGVARAEARTLFLLVSGEPADIERIRPLLPVIGSEHRIVGCPGAASRIKCVQNGLGLVQLAAMAEALTLVAADGGDLDRFVEVVAGAGGMAASPLFRAAAPRMREPAPEPAERLRIGAKDSVLAEGLAEELGLDLPLFRRTAELFRAALGQGLGEADIAAIARALERETGIRLARADDAPR